MKRILLLLAALIAVACVASCDSGSHPPSTKEQLVFESIAYTDHDQQERFKDALKQAGVPFEISIGKDQREYVKWKGEDSTKVHKIQVSLFREPPPSGRSINFSEPYNDRFKKWLTDNGIPFTTMLSNGKEYVVWKAADYPRFFKW